MHACPVKAPRCEARLRSSLAKSAWPFKRRHADRAGALSFRSAAASVDEPERAIGAQKDALRELAKPAVVRQTARKVRAAKQKAAA